jgi:hypothetical protein
MLTPTDKRLSPEDEDLLNDEYLQDEGGVWSPEVPVARSERLLASPQQEKEVSPKKTLARPAALPHSKGWSRSLNSKIKLTGIKNYESFYIRKTLEIVNSGDKRFKDKPGEKLLFDFRFDPRAPIDILASLDLGPMASIFALWARNAEYTAPGKSADLMSPHILRKYAENVQSYLDAYENADTTGTLRTRRCGAWNFRSKPFTDFHVACKELAERKATTDVTSDVNIAAFVASKGNASSVLPEHAAAFISYVWKAMRAMEENGFKKLPDFALAEPKNTGFADYLNAARAHVQLCVAFCGANRAIQDYELAMIEDIHPFKDKVGINK